MISKKDKSLLVRNVDSNSKSSKPVMNVEHPKTIADAMNPIPVFSAAVDQI